ncbi:LysM peptidoglycan-binding domain-containing protein [Rhizocola hellebori]|nr:LysM domain-containing protein [Rhizocola hellebori]
MTTASRPGKDTDVGGEMRKIAATMKAKPGDSTKPKGGKATAPDGDQAAGFSLPFGLGKKDTPAANTPTPQAQAAPPAPARTYTVKPGDTLWDIAVSHYGDGRQYRKIASANNIADPNRISSGLELTIPQ